MRHVIRFLSLFVLAILSVAVTSTVQISAQDKKARNAVPLHALYANSDLIVGGSVATVAQFPHGNSIVSGNNASKGEFPWQLSLPPGSTNSIVGGNPASPHEFPWQTGGRGAVRHEAILNINSYIKGTAPSQIRIVTGGTAAPERGIFFLVNIDGEYHALKLRGELPSITQRDAADLRELHEIYLSDYEVNARVTDWLVARAADPRTRAGGVRDLDILLEAGSSMDPNGNNQCANGDQGSACDPNGGGRPGGLIGSGTKTDEGSGIDPHGRADSNGGYLGSGNKVDENTGGDQGRDEGPYVDPNGRPANRKRAGIDPNGNVPDARGSMDPNGNDGDSGDNDSDDGPGIDPDGRTGSRSGYIGSGFRAGGGSDESCHLDPNGGCAGRGARKAVKNSGANGNTLEAGVRIDGNGANRGGNRDGGGAMDPNGNVPDSRGTMDPDGKPAAPSTPEAGPRMDDNGRQGLGMDPNGRSRAVSSKNKSTTEAGWQMDPNGSGSPVGPDGGPYMDPNGRRGAEIDPDRKLGPTLDPIGAKVFGMDPNGRPSGSCIDPNGQPCVKRHDGTETGSMIDPWGGENGSCIDPLGQPCVKRGPYIDPNGGNSADSGPIMDPNGKRGIMIDPDGRPASQSKCQSGNSNVGCGIDPNGKHAAAKGMGLDPNGRGASEYTMCVDPNGRCAPRAAAEYTACIDPNGRCAPSAAAEYTGCIDPNGRGGVCDPNGAHAEEGATICPLGKCGARFSAAQKLRLAEAFFESNDTALLRAVAAAFDDRGLTELARAHAVLEARVSEWDSEILKRSGAIVAAFKMRLTTLLAG